MSNKKRITLKGLFNILKNAFTYFGDDKITKLSGSLAYSTVFSLGPLMIVIISLCGLFLGREAIEGQVYQQPGVIFNFSILCSFPLIVTSLLNTNRIIPK